MIPSAADYHFITGADIDAAHPHGDLDRILIGPDAVADPFAEDADGDVKLYGEPIAWLMEALRGRWYEGTFDPKWYGGDNTFTRMIDGQQANSICAGFNSLCAYPFVMPEVWTSAGSGATPEITYDATFHKYDFHDTIKKTFTRRAVFWGDGGYPFTVTPIQSGDPIGNPDGGDSTVKKMCDRIASFAGRAVYDSDFNFDRGPSYHPYFTGSIAEEFRESPYSVLEWPFEKEDCDGRGYLRRLESYGYAYWEDDPKRWDFAYRRYHADSGARYVIDLNTPAHQDTDFFYVKSVRPIYTVKFYDHRYYAHSHAATTVETNVTKHTIVVSEHEYTPVNGVIELLPERDLLRMDNAGHYEPGGVSSYDNWRPKDSMMVAGEVDTFRAELTETIEDIHLLCTFSDAIKSIR